MENERYIWLPTTGKVDVSTDGWIEEKCTDKTLSIRDACMIECFGICSENCTAWQNGKCVLDAKKAEVIYDFETKESAEEKQDHEGGLTMPDIEKVIRAIETHMNTDASVGCDDCTYENDGRCMARVLADALELLKEYKRQAGCPCTHCTVYECEEVCEEYKKWRDL